MMTWFFRAIPPSAMTLLTGILLGEALHNGASAEGGGGDRPPNSAGASVAGVKVGDHPFRRWLAFGVRRPLNQSSTTGRCSSDGLLAQASVSAGSNCFWLALICSRNAGCC